MYDEWLNWRYILLNVFVFPNQNGTIQDAYPTRSVIELIDAKSGMDSKVWPNNTQVFEDWSNDENKIDMERPLSFLYVGDY